MQYSGYLDRKMVLEGGEPTHGRNRVAGGRIGIVHQIGEDDPRWNPGVGLYVELLHLARTVLLPVTDSERSADYPAR